MEAGDLRKAQLCQLDIAKEIKRICEKENIQYFLAYGTMIGAVRHKGFIPWDDDMDIAMLREDYDRFIVACKTELSNKYFLQTFETDPYYGWPFAKVLKEGTVYKEEWTSKEVRNGVFVDIFPIDDAGKLWSDKISKVLFRYYLRMLHIKIGYTGFLNQNIAKKAFKMVLTFLAHFYSDKELKKKINKILTKEAGKGGRFVHNYNSGYKESSEKMPKEWLSDTIQIEFEGESFAILKEYDAYLRKMYGDYMQLPPESQRENRHRIVEFKV